ncbi:hypothetical protein [Paenibacillus tuaregi]|uniref:hypothetical protein n=1 Tax=Paenibacillus tuaregi TaxID=1816681 RepID=UPI000837BB36|nr:hypothetical protein [Paenibacillus tuaregi]
MGKVIGKDLRNRFTSSKPHDISWRTEQVKVDNFIEGVVPDKDIESFVARLDKLGINEAEKRIKMIGRFIKEKEKEKGEH